MTERPEWLVRHLERIGRVDADGVRRAVRLRRCPGCGADVLVGLDSDMAGIAVTADPRALDAEGELRARLSGRTTFELAASGGRLVLDSRHVWSIRGRPADPNSRYPVVAEHHCGAPLGHDPPRSISESPPSAPPY